MRWKANREVTFDPVYLPEFGLEVSWAMCRNPMCPNFGVFFTKKIPKGGTSTSDENYRVRIKVATSKYTDESNQVKTSSWLAGEIECRGCGKCSRLASNRSIRTIARYYLSLSLPFADCANPECPSHGVNVFEHWENPARGQTRHYRKSGGEHQVCCRHCGSRKSRRGRRERRAGRIKKARKGQENGTKINPIKHEPFSPYINLGEVMGPHGMGRTTRRTWGKIIEGVRTARSVTDSYEIIEELSISTYYRHLNRIAARLRDYHSARNVRLVHPSFAKWDKPIRLYTDVLDVSLQAWEKGKKGEKGRHHMLLKYIVTAVPVGGTIFILAAHPFFLPDPLCPKDTDRDRDDPKLRMNFEREWDGLLHEGIAREPGFTSKKAKEDYPEIGRGGYFIRSPYAEVAHFLTVQKMLSRFQTMYCYTDAASKLFTAALVAMRERILAGRPGANRPADGRRRGLPTTEIVLFQHKNKERVREGKVYTDPYEDLTVDESTRKRRKLLLKAWRSAEKRIHNVAIKDLKKAAKKRARRPTFEDLKKDPKLSSRTKLKWSTLTPDERAAAHRDAYRKAFKGGHAKYGGWAWLKFPADSAMYRLPRTLWLTRMPGKRFSRHGKDILMEAWLQPVDTALNSIRARVRGAHRPLTRAIGRGFAQNYVLPQIVQSEMTIYLVGRNYSLRRKTRQRFVPATRLGLATRDLKAELLHLMVEGDRDAAVALLEEHPNAAERLFKRKVEAAAAFMKRQPNAAIKVLRKAPSAPKLDYLKQAWDFRLGITDAERISRWLRT